MSEKVRYVKLKPYNKLAGHVARRHSHKYSLNGVFYTFSTPGVWYKVPTRLAQELAGKHQIPTRVSSPLVFDVCTEADARERDAREKEERERMRAIVEPSVDTAMEVKVEAPGRGDLSLDDITTSRKRAIEDVVIDPPPAKVVSASAVDTWYGGNDSEAPKPKKRGRPKKKVVE